jgi:hypothetical protein
MVAGISRTGQTAGGRRRRPAREQAAGRRDELAKGRANAEIADVDRDRRLPTLFGKPSRQLAPTPA